jgi:hypothetical protein
MSPENTTPQESEKDPADVHVYLGLTALGGAGMVSFGIAAIENVGVPYTSLLTVGCALVVADYGHKLFKALIG